MLRRRLLTGGMSFLCTCKWFVRHQLLLNAVLAFYCSSILLYRFFNPFRSVFFGYFFSFFRRFSAIFFFFGLFVLFVFSIVFFVYFYHKFVEICIDLSMFLPCSHRFFSFSTDMSSLCAISLNFWLFHSFPLLSPLSDCAFLDFFLSVLCTLFVGGKWVFFLQLAWFRVPVDQNRNGANTSRQWAHFWWHMSIWFDK